MIQIIFLVTFGLAVFQAQASESYDANKVIDPYFCLNKDTDNYVHPNGACDHYVACGVGCKTATTQNYNLQCTQHIMPCPSGLFFIPGLNGGRCDYKEMSHCLQFQDEVCYGARNGKHGVFQPVTSGTVTKLKLYHKSGGVSCVPQTYQGFWGGCPHESDQGRPLNIWITADKNFRNKKYEQIKYDVKFPVPSVALTANTYGFYGLEDFKDMDELIYHYSGYGEEAVTFDRYHKCRVYYGEDLFDLGTNNNNAGTHCIKIYAGFYRPLSP